jgi:hypothetical protein
MLAEAATTPKASATAAAATAEAAATAAATTEAAATAAAATATGARTIFSFVHAEGAAVELATVPLGDGRLCVSLGTHAHESEAAGAARFAIHHYCHFRHLAAAFLKRRAQ